MAMAAFHRACRQGVTARQRRRVNEAGDQRMKREAGEDLLSC
jgi:hypothetical protein